MVVVGFFFISRNAIAPGVSWRRKDSKERNQSAIDLDVDGVVPEVSAVLTAEKEVLNFVWFITIMS